MTRLDDLERLEREATREGAELLSFSLSESEWRLYLGMRNVFGRMLAVVRAAQVLMDTARGDDGVAEQLLDDALRALEE